MHKQLLLLELNELNFEFVGRYGERHRLPNLTRLIKQHGLSRTTSETRYEHLEPWIQWVTAHTGKTFAEHKVFRLGDIVEHDIPQIWESLEDLGLRVGAISPMNAKHRVKEPAFFVPDPWTRTRVTANSTLTRLHKALSQAVNENASGALSAGSVAALVGAFARYARLGNAAAYLRLIPGSVRRRWYKAIFLDLFLSDVFLGETLRTRPHFASLFLNGAAHIQHHYMFCAGVYTGKNRNPPWYVNPRVDPILDVYETYDRIVGMTQARFPQARIMIATGLHQEPHEELTFYWRLKDHAAFLRKIGISFEEVKPLMSRDFIIVCADDRGAAVAEKRLASAKGHDDVPLFDVDNRGRDLFVMLTYPHDIADGFGYVVDGEKFAGLDSEVAFVALKNGEHDGIGYFIDTGANARDFSPEFPLQEIPSRITAAVGV